MSAAPLRNYAPTRTAPSPAAAPRQRDHLRAVSAPEPGRSLLPFAALCVFIVLGALATVLLLNTTMSRGAWEANSMRIEISKAEQQRATLLTQLEASANPAGLANAAAGLGMVQAERIGFVSIGSAAVLESGGR